MDKHRYDLRYGKVEVHESVLPPQKRTRITQAKTVGGYPEEVVTFKSLYDLVDEVDRSRVPGSGALDGYNGYLCSEDTISPGLNLFNRAKTVSEAVELARYGWKEGRERLAPFEAALERELRKEVRTNRFVQDLAGFEVDVPTFLTGQPEHMLAFQEGQTRAKAIEVVVDINVRCDACGSRQHDAEPTDPQWLLVRGAAVTMLMKLLIRAGYKPTLRLRTTSVYYPVGEYPGKQHGIDEAFLRTIDMVVHGPGDVFDVDRINFVLSHDSMIRRLEWRIHEVMNATAFGRPRGINRNSDQPVGQLPLGKTHKRGLISRLPRGDIFVPGIPIMVDFEPRDGECDIGYLIEGQDDAFTKGKTDPAEAIGWVFRSLENQGVKFD